ncbi:TPA: hypothetical protein QDZ84_002884 [Shewanella algae]|uniref:hypothetical protein n=1 Tax=Shewanella algae TaxID=38313 RepID=UPI001C5694D7|nr:hypothetical protein [Shewanella algae]HDS1207857.1 hypothetical protein [Shewanella algae]
MSEYLGVVETTVFIEDGRRYLSNIADIDIGFGNRLLAELNELQEPESPRASKALINFCAREPKQKLFKHSEQDPKQFLRKLRQKARSKDDFSKKNDLPIVYFHRLPGISFNDDGSEIVGKTVGHISDETGVIANVDEIPCSISYQVYVLSWDEVSLNKIAASLMASGLIGQRNFTYKTVVLNSVLDGDAVVAPAQLSSWEDASISAEEDRLLVLSSVFSMKAPIYQARGVTSKTLTISINPPVPFYANSDLGGN